MKPVTAGHAVIAAAIFATYPAAAQNTQAPPPPSCEEAPYTDFAFWLGEWDVYNPQGQLAGTNSVTAHENGCLMIEDWTGAGGGTGQSYNFYDPGLKQWRQVWVAQGAVIDYAGGLDAEGRMVLTGTIAYRASGQTADFRGIWTANPDGSVLQEFEQYDAEAEEWTGWFTGLYMPQGHKPPGAAEEE